jgi:hypothetical protein
MATGGKSLADRLFPVVEEKEEIAVIDIPPEQRRLHTETYDFSISTITDYLKQGSIFVPSFQRGYVWNRSQASRLIESLIIQCPIPVIYLNQEKDERLAVIDGNQRLTSIKLFLEDEFLLQGLTAYPELEGFAFSGLDPRFRRHIQNRTLRCITILKETHPQIKIDVFERINTGAVQLNPQEVRHGVYHGPLIKLIDELSSEKIWKDISGYRNDNRMRGSELILRYFALLNDQANYKKPLKQFLNNFCEKFSSISDLDILSWKNRFLSTIESVNYLFGKKAFRMLDENLKPTVKNVNSALMDAVMVGLTKSGLDLDDLIKIDRNDFLRHFQKLLGETRFRESIESGTSATSSVNYRVKRFEKFMIDYFSK